MEGPKQCCLSIGPLCLSALPHSGFLALPGILLSDFFPLLFQELPPTFSPLLKILHQPLRFIFKPLLT